MRMVDVAKMSMSRSPDSIDAAEQILNFARDFGINPTPMQLLKLTYIAHGWFLGLRDDPLVSDDVEAWKYGPVFRRLYNCVRGYGRKPVENLPKVARPIASFTEDALEVMKQVVAEYGEYSGPQLSDITHRSGTPWSETYDRHGESAVIPQDLIMAHYQKLAGREPDEICPA